MLFRSHLVPCAPPQDADLERARSDLARVQRVLALLGSEGADVADGSEAADVDAILREAEEIGERRRALEEEAAARRLEAQRLEPFGAFDPERVRALAAHGIAVRLFREPVRRSVAVPEGALRVVLREEGSIRHVVVIGPTPLTCSGDEQTGGVARGKIAKRRMERIEEDAGGVAA